MRSMLILSVAAFVFAAPFASAGDAHSDEYPARAVRVIVPFAPGGGTDVVGRILAALIKSDMDKWGSIGKRLGVKLD